MRLLFNYCLILCITCSTTTFSQEFTYFQVDDKKSKWGDYDDPDWLRYFGLDMGDVNGDGLLDILTGRNIYLQPEDAENSWEKLDIGMNADGFMIIDVDGDEYTDIIAMALPNVYWMEANNDLTEWSQTVIAQIPATSHTNSQGFTRADLSDNGKIEILIAGDGDIYAIEIPGAPKDASWPVWKIGINTSDEGIGVGDIDGDGDMDIAAGRRAEGESEPLILVWFENPGTLSEGWKDIEAGQTNHPADRVGIADIDNDGKSDIIVAEERWPGLEPDGNIFWYRQNAPDDWQRNHITTQYSSNNLDVQDIDNDGDMDILTAEHKGPDLEIQLWLNDGSGDFQKKVIDSGKENHLGILSADMDGDGDLDIIGIGWDKYQFVHYWRNESR